MKKVAALVSGVLAGSLVFVGITGFGYSAAEEPQGGLPAAEELSCASDDLIYMYEAQPLSNSESEEATETPQEGLADLVDDQLDLDPADFDVVASGDDEVEFVNEQPGGDKATALAELKGGQWVVTAFSACNEFLKEEQSADEGGAQS